MRGQLGVTLPTRKGAEQNELEGLKVAQVLFAATNSCKLFNPQQNRGGEEEDKGGGAGGRGRIYILVYTFNTHTSISEGERTTDATHGRTDSWGGGGVGSCTRHTFTLSS